MNLKSNIYLNAILTSELAFKSNFMLKFQSHKNFITYETSDINYVSHCS